MGIFDVVIHHAEDLDYSTMEYLGSIENPDEIFHAEILISGLGAIMDVAVAIAASLSEIVEKKSEVTFLELFKSGREIGYDIMGTMINVLLFVFGCGLIPMCLIRMNNDVSLITIIKLHIPCELCRFLVESIGIVLAILISILVTSVMIKVARMFRRQKKARKVQEKENADNTWIDFTDFNYGRRWRQRCRFAYCFVWKSVDLKSCNLAYGIRSSCSSRYGLCRCCHFLYYVVLSKW